MGADGHIIIYDLTAIRKELTDEEISIVINSQVYYHEIFGKQVLTEYYGDNLPYDAANYEDQYGWCDSENPEVTKDHFNKVWGIIKKHRITSWEVWT